MNQDTNMNQVRRTIMDVIVGEYMTKHSAKLIKEGREASTEWSDWSINRYLFGNVMASAGLGALDEDDLLVRDISYQIFCRLDECKRCIRQAKEALEKDRVTEFEETAEEPVEKDRVTELMELADEVEELVQAQEDNNQNEEN